MIIGTAGHVDHGKTELIKALTGVDTDRLREEKERGVSIDIGFAAFHFPNGQLAGVIDVPGHERFIHNMLAGIGGIDLVLLVIDAAEGVMPQTREHMEILGLLQIKKGLVVITKIDLVDEEWLELVEEEVREYLQETFLQDAPLYKVSSVTGEGIEELKEAVVELGSTISSRDIDAPLYLPIDRIFSVSGFGSVITGTLVSGKVRIGEMVEVLPPGKEFRVRGMHIHGKAVSEALAGQRVALNLVGLEKSQVTRGSVVAAPGYFQLTRACDARVQLLSKKITPLSNRTPVHFYLGTARVVARLILLGKDELPPGEEGYVQCRLDKPLVAKRGDRFIIRSYSPMVTIGGGVVLDEHPPRHKRFKREVIQRLQEMEKEDPLPYVLERLKERKGAALEELSKLTKMGKQHLQELLEKALQENRVRLLGDYYVPTSILEEWEAQVIRELERFHQRNNLAPGMPRARLLSALPEGITQRTFDKLLEGLRKRGEIDVSGDLVFRKGFIPEPNKKQKDNIERLLAIFEEKGLNPPPPGELWSLLGIGEEEGEALLEHLIHRGLLVKVSEEIFLHGSVYRRCLEELMKHLQENRSITLAQYRDHLQTSRKYAQALLEHFDGCRFTRRVGDERVPLKLPKNSSSGKG